MNHGNLQMRLSNRRGDWHMKLTMPGGSNDTCLSVQGTRLTNPASLPAASIARCPRGQLPYRCCASRSRAGNTTLALGSFEALMCFACRTEQKARNEHGTMPGVCFTCQEYAWPGIAPQQPHLSSRHASTTVLQNGQVSRPQDTLIGHRVHWWSQRCSFVNSCT